MITNWYTDEAIKKKNEDSKYVNILTSKDVSYDVTKVLDRKLKCGQFWYLLQFEPIRNIDIGTYETHKNKNSKY